MITKEIEEKLNDACKIAYNVSLENLRLKNRSRNLSDIRHIICYYYMNNTKLTTMEIGYLIERDHSTVVHGNKKISMLIESNDKEINTKLGNFIEAISDNIIYNVMNKIIKLPIGQRIVIVEKIEKIIKELK